MGPFGRFKEQAGRGLELLREAYGLIQEARQKNGEARDQLATAAQGSGNERIDASLTRLEQVAEALDRAAGHTIGGAEDFKAYLVEIGAGDVAGGGGGGPSTPERPAGADSAPEPLRLKDFRAAKKHAVAEERVRNEAGWDDFNDDGSLRAKGFMYDADGRPLFGGKMLPASGKGPGSDTSDLKEPYRSDERLTLRWHVEGHAAAFMRRNEITKAVLYLNMNPCGNRGPDQPPDPLRCEANVADHLPPGSTLWIHSVHEDGSVRSKPYRGTGKALKDE